MNKKMVSGNEAVAYAALSAGVKVVAGYPGTPSSEVIGSLMKMPALDDVTVEWSTSEKVATEIAAGAAWSGQRALCTMKMSGLNVAYDSLAGIAYSGCIGGMVVYVCDDPGVTTGMVEQDVRGFAQMSNLVMLEPASVQQSYDLIRYAFELSEQIGYPVFVRSVTNVAQSHAAIEIAEPQKLNRTATYSKDINRYTKAGAKICLEQHRAVLAGLAKAEKLLAEQPINQLMLAKNSGGLGIITVGVVNGFLTEALEIAAAYVTLPADISVLKIGATIPFPTAELRQMLTHCQTIVVAEETEPYLERELYVQGYTIQAQAKIIGKLDGTLSRLGAYDALTVAKAICAAMGGALPTELSDYGREAAELATARPIGLCAGCPHRGTFLAINKAIRNLKYKKDEVIVTGDIGCTILGMNPPFDTLWTEIAMGASIPLAQGFVYGGIEKPVLATIGDSTFFLGGMPGLVNAVQHNINLTVVVMDNSWTGMTGMQINPSTPQEFQINDCQTVDIVEVIAGMGVAGLQVVDPFQLTEMTAAIEQGIQQQGVQVIVARRECAIQSNRRKIRYGKISVDSTVCNLCKSCISVTGCPAIELRDGAIMIDSGQCNGCGLCTFSCARGALKKEVL